MPGVSTGAASMAAAPVTGVPEKGERTHGTLAELVQGRRKLGRVPGVVVRAPPGLRDALQLLASRRVDVEADGVDLQVDTGSDDGLDLRAGVGHAGLLPVRVEDEVALAGSTQVARPA